jgi:hypothetical protein
LSIASGKEKPSIPQTFGISNAVHNILNQCFQFAPSDRPLTQEVLDVLCTQ